MTDRDPLITLARLLDDVPVRPLPDVLRDETSTGRRRGAVTVVLGAAAAVVLVVAGGMVASRLLSTPELDARNLPAEVRGSPAAQTRQVGIGRVTVEVPADWVNEEGGCLEEPGQVVYVGLVNSCGRGSGNPASSSSLTLGTDPDAIGAVLGEVQGREIRGSRVECRPLARKSCSQYFAVPDLDAWFVVTVPDAPGALRRVGRIRTSLRVLPTGQTTIPPYVALRESSTEYAFRLRSRGFVVKTTEPYCAAAADCAGYSVEPEPGSVVEEGSTVTLVAY